MVAEVADGACEASPSVARARWSARGASARAAALGRGARGIEGPSHSAISCARPRASARASDILVARARSRVCVLVLLCSCSCCACARVRVHVRVPAARFLPSEPRHAHPETEGRFRAGLCSSGSLDLPPTSGHATCSTIRCSHVPGVDHTTPSRHCSTLVAGVNTSRLAAH